MARDELDRGVAAAHMTEGVGHLRLVGVDDVGGHLETVGNFVKAEGVEYADRDGSVPLVGVVQQFTTRAVVDLA